MKCSLTYVFHLFSLHAVLRSLCKAFSRNLPQKNYCNQDPTAEQSINECRGTKHNPKRFSDQMQGRAEAKPYKVAKSILKARNNFKNKQSSQIPEIQREILSVVSKFQAPVVSSCTGCNQDHKSNTEQTGTQEEVLKEALCWALI